MSNSNTKTFESIVTGGLKRLRASNPNVSFLAVEAYKTKGSSTSLEDLDNYKIIGVLDGLVTMIIHYREGKYDKVPVILSWSNPKNLIVDFSQKITLAEALANINKIKDQSFEFSRISLSHPISSKYPNPEYNIGTNPTEISYNIDAQTGDTRLVPPLLTMQYAEITLTTEYCGVVGANKVDHGKSGDSKDFYFPEGKITSTGTLRDASGWSMAGASGTMTLYVYEGKDGSGNYIKNTEIGTLHYRSPYSGTNEFTNPVTKSGFTITITGKGTSGKKKGALGSVSASVSKDEDNSNH